MHINILKNNIYLVYLGNNSPDLIMMAWGNKNDILSRFLYQ